MTDDETGDVSQHVQMARILKRIPANPDDRSACCGVCGRRPPAVKLRLAIIPEAAPPGEEMVSVWILCEGCGVLKGAIWPARGAPGE